MINVRHIILLGLLCSSGQTQIQVQMAQATEILALPYTRVELSRKYYTEGAAIADINRDSKPDVVSGPFWYPGPKFDKSHPIYAARAFPIGGYADRFFSFPHDFNGDGWIDVMTMGQPGQPAYWFENPRKTGPLWKRWTIWATCGTESPILIDLDRDGMPEIICETGNYLIYLKADPKDPRKTWTPHRVSPLRGFPVYTHGIGAGDINGDGRVDILTLVGWFEQPKSLVGDPPWPAHPGRFGHQWGGARIFAHDVDGDGDNDIITSMNAHGYGLSWFEQTKTGNTIVFREHVIQKTSKDPTDPHQFSQPHGLTLADIDGDGRLDIVTGKTFFAHNGTDPGALDAPVLYCFRFDNTAGIRFVPSPLDIISGAGRQIATGDLDGDGRVDIAVAGKKGQFLFLSGR